MSHRRDYPDEPRTPSLRMANVLTLYDTSRGEDGEPSEEIGTFDTLADALKSAREIMSWEITRAGTVVARSTTLREDMQLTWNARTMQRLDALEAKLAALEAQPA